VGLALGCPVVGLPLLGLPFLPFLPFGFPHHFGFPLRFPINFGFPFNFIPFNFIFSKKRLTKSGTRKRN
jgi:hypothetical protein